tara:strand:+ start:269 stop:571 length:303 start_codon:yes stop_codon:yes gene_type:complete
LESSYEKCLAFELMQNGLKIQIQVPVPVLYKGIKLDVSYRLDIIVEEKVIIEVKTVSELMPIHKAQLLTYLKLTRIKLGLLINFNSIKLIDGVKRVANNL